MVNMTFMTLFYHCQNQLGQNTGSRLTALLSRLDAASEVDRLCDTEVQNVSEKMERTKMNQANIDIVT